MNQIILGLGKRLLQNTSDVFEMVFSRIPNPDWDFRENPGIRDLVTKSHFYPPRGT